MSTATFNQDKKDLSKINRQINLFAELAALGKRPPPVDLNRQILYLLGLGTSPQFPSPALLPVPGSP
ncbi:hypothetical protein [Geoalkalibacter halelectricus]|uniref:hypothetical protein n=1 Tax=Geoalkalibacter halelectricus TaxID=2847045 RepID=UPI00266F7A2A|nr:hypothetical protein [Geoalkalibacter halelectricus]